MSKHLFSGPLFPPDLQAKIADRYAMFAGVRMEATGGDGGGEGGGGDSGGGGEQTFTQADVDRIVAERLKRERETTKTKYADYDDLKKRAEGAKSLEDRVAEIEKQAKASEDRALRAEIANAKGLTPSQAKRLIGSTREELEADADDLLKDIAASESERKKRGNRVPDEGKTTPKPGEDEMRDFTRKLFGRD